MKKKIAKYLEISKDIISEIESGYLQPGDKILSENELIKKYKISNTTARKILLEIELKGYVLRLKGKGTFVVNRSEDMHLTRILGSFDTMKDSFSNNLIKEGLTPRNLMMEKVILENGISTNVNGRNYSIEGPVLKLHRLRYANDILMKDETKYVSMTICKKIHLQDLDKSSLFQLYEDKYNLQIENVQRTIGTTVQYPDTLNNFFENEIPLAMFILNGICTVGKGKIVEIEYSLYRGDKYRFAINTKPELLLP